MDLGLWTLHLQRNGNTRVRNSISEIDRPINRIHHPTLRGIGIAGNSFLAQQRDLGETRAQNPANQLLTANIQFQFDVMLVGSS